MGKDSNIVKATFAVIFLGLFKHFINFIWHCSSVLQAFLTTGCCDMSSSVSSPSSQTDAKTQKCSVPPSCSDPSLICAFSTLLMTLQHLEIINSPVTEAQNHIHPRCHWLLLFPFEIYDNPLSSNFSFGVSHITLAETSDKA